MFSNNSNENKVENVIIRSILLNYFNNANMKNIWVNTKLNSFIIFL